MIESINLKAPFEGFDLDLYSILPDLRDDLETVCRDVALWGFVSSRDGETFSSITYWNTVGCVLLTSIVDINRTTSGWYEVHGHTTDSEPMKLPLSEIIRYLWVQSCGAAIDWWQWIAHNEHSRRLHDDVLGHIRGWSPQTDIDDKLSRVRSWALLKARQAAGYANL